MAPGWIMQPVNVAMMGGGMEKYRNTGCRQRAYHFAAPNETGKKPDPYAGVVIGYLIANYSCHNGYNVPGYGLPAGKAGGIAVDAFAGAHYLFSPHICVFGELGYTSFSILSLGIAFKF